MDLITIALSQALSKKYTDEQIANLGIDDVSYYFCSSTEYNSTTGVPIITSPDGNTLYVVPSITGGNGFFNVYVYKNNDWDLFISIDMDETNIPIDNSLAISGMAADAKQVGDEITDLRTDLSDITEASSEEIDKSTFVKLDNCFIGSGTVKAISSETGTYTMYAPCSPNTTYIVEKVLSARFVVGYTTVIPAIGTEVYGFLRRDNETEIEITTGADAAYLVVYYKHGSDTLSESEIYNSISIKYNFGLSAVDIVARSGLSVLEEEIEQLNPGLLSDNAKTALLACFNHLFWKEKDGKTFIDTLRVALGVSNRRPELPDTYEQVEYIYGNGNQWITFDFLSQIPFSVDAEMLYTRNDANMIVANTDWSSDQSRRFVLLGYNDFGSGANTDIGMRVGNNPWTYSHGYDLNTIYKIQMGVYQIDNSYKAYVQVDDNERVETTLNNAPSLGYPMRLLKRDADSWVGRGAYFYSLVCYGGGSQKIFDGIPCYRKSDNVSGFYDAVTNTFYPSEGTSNFLIGPIVEQ